MPVQNVIVVIVRPPSNSLHHFAYESYAHTLFSVDLIQLGIPGAMFFAHRKRITERNLPLADGPNGKSISNGRQTKTEHRSELAGVVICGGGGYLDMGHSSGGNSDPCDSSGHFQLVSIGFFFCYYQFSFKSIKRLYLCLDL